VEREKKTTTEDEEKKRKIMSKIMVLSTGVQTKKRGGCASIQNSK